MGCVVCTTNQAKKDLLNFVSSTNHQPLASKYGQATIDDVTKKILCTVCKLKSYRPYPPDMQINSFANSSSFPSFEKNHLRAKLLHFFPNISEKKKYSSS